MHPLLPTALYFSAPTCMLLSSDLDDAGAYEGDGDGHRVDGQLELEELGDAVVDVATPHHRLDDTREIVVRQNNVGSLLGHVRTRNALCNNH